MTILKWMVLTRKPLLDRYSAPFQIYCKQTDAYSTQRCHLRRAHWSTCSISDKEAISLGMFNSCLYPPPLKSPLQISKNITQLKWRRQSASRRLSGNKPPLSTCRAVEGCHACHPLAHSCCWIRTSQTDSSSNSQLSRAILIWRLGSFSRMVSSSWCMMMFHGDSNHAFERDLTYNLVTDGASKPRQQMFVAMRPCQPTSIVLPGRKTFISVRTCIVSTHVWNWVLGERFDQLPLRTFRWPSCLLLKIVIP